MTTNFDLDNRFTLWYHYDKKNWNISGYKKILIIDNTKILWQIINNWHIFANADKHFFIMKGNIKPIWEDNENINGGCWSFKVKESYLHKIFELIFTSFVSNNILKNNNNNDSINGISICKKKNNFFIIKIWNKNSKLNSSSNISDTILNYWNDEIIYISNVTAN